MTSTLRRWFDRLERFFSAVLDGLLVVLLGAMILIAVGQIVLRIFFNSGFVWADELLKLMVLWIAMIASIAASRSDRHLRIDVLSHFVAPPLARLPRILVDTFAAGICAMIAWQAFRFIELNREFDDTVLIDFPAWIANAIVPVAFGLMALQFLVLSGRELLKLLAPERSVEVSK